MNIHFLIAIISVFMAFIIPSLFYKLSFVGNNPFTNNKQLSKSIFLPFIISSFILCSAVYPIAFDRQDFLFPFSFIELVSPFLAAILLFFCSKISRTAKYFTIFLLLASLACTFSIPTKTIAAILPLPTLYTRLIIFCSWFLFGYFYRYANTGGATLGIQSAAITIGISVLSIVGAIPFFLGVAGMIISAGCLAVMAVTWPPSNKSVSDNSSSCLGFIIFALMLWTAGEQALSCVIIFSLYFVTDFIWALMLNLTFMEQYSDIKENTSYRQALAQGISPQTASGFFCRGQILIIILGVLQAFNSQPNSLLLISIFVSIWISHKMRNLSENNKTMKDLNKEVLEDIQARIDNIKQFVNKEEDDQ